MKTGRANIWKLLLTAMSLSPLTEPSGDKREVLTADSHPNRALLNSNLTVTYTIYSSNLCKPPNSHDCRMRSRFDPRGIKKALQERNADAVASAKVFADDVKSGVLNPNSEDFNQGTLKFGCAQDQVEQTLLEALSKAL